MSYVWVDVFGIEKMGWIMYDLIFGVVCFDMCQMVVYFDCFFGVQNLYNFVDFGWLLVIGIGFMVEQCVVDMGVYVLDCMMLLQYWQVIVGLCYMCYISEQVFNCYEVSKIMLLGVVIYKFMLVFLVYVLYV